jgi:hypothetical protein
VSLMAMIEVLFLLPPPSPPPAAGKGPVITASSLACPSSAPTG